MKQENIKKVMEQIRSKKNNETNELVVVAKESSLNTTTEATMSVASARALTTTTISADNYLWLESYDENGNACEEPIIGNYEGSMYVLVGGVDMPALLAANNISGSADLSACYLTIYGDAGNFSWAYNIYDINGNFVTYRYGNGTEVYVPLKEVYDASGDWGFILEPAVAYDYLHFSGTADLEVTHYYNPIMEVNRYSRIIADDYVNMISVDEMGQVGDGLYLGVYNSVLYGIAVSVNMDALLNDNNITMSNIQDCNFTLFAESENLPGVYQINEPNGTTVTVVEGNEDMITIPVKEVYDLCASWNFVIVPLWNHEAVEMTDYVDMDVWYSEEVELTGIEISSPPNKTNYIEGDFLDPTGMVVKAIFADGTKEEITDYTISHTGELRNTYESFSVNYKGYSVRQEINVDKVLSLFIQGSLSETEYKIGEEINLSGIQLYANIEGGGTQRITNFNVYPKKFWKAGESVSVTLSYGEDSAKKTATLSVLVEEDEKKLSKVNQSEVKYSCGAGDASINLFTKRLLLERQDMSIGANSYQIGVSHIYNSAFDEEADLRYGNQENDFFKTYMGKGFKLNVQQYVFAIDDHYVYIDGAGYRHTFDALGDGVSYYDTSGLGLILSFENNYKVISDEAGNKMYFDALGRLEKTVSCHNEALVKKFVYNSKGQLVLVYDNRTASNQIKFTYSSTTNLLKTMTCGYANSENDLRTINYTYNSNGWLTEITDEQGGAKFVYDTTNKIMKFAVSKPDNYALKFENNTGKVTSVTQGIYANGNMSSSNVQRRNVFSDSLEGKCVTVCDQKGDTVDFSKDLNVNYYFNEKGFTTAILEANNGNSNDLRSMKKLPGTTIPLSGAEVSGVTINTQAVYRFNAQNGFTLNTIPEKLDNYRRLKYNAYKYYNVTFWLKLETVFAHSVVKVNVTSEQGAESSSEESSVHFDNTAVGVWQYVTIPVKISKESIKAINVTFDNGTSSEVYQMADMRLTYAAFPGYYIKLEGESGWAPMNSVTSIQYTLADGTVETKPISVDCYMSGKDLQATFLNMYKNRELETSGNYVLSLCDGTKKYWVQNAVITTPNVYENANEAEPNFPLKFDNTESEEYGLALYNHETISPDGSTSTYGYVRFYPSVTLGTYNGSAIMQLTKSTCGNVATESYVYMDLMGRVLQKVDEYGVITTYEYHTDGSLKKQTIKSGDQSMVVYENTQKTSDDGQYDILTDKSFNLGEKYTYHNLFGTLDKVERLCYNESTETVYNTTNYGYDSYYEQLLSVSSTADNQTHTNTLTYEDGVLSTVTDGKVNYKFTYDKATDTATFNVEDGSDWKKLEETELDHDLNTVTHKYYRNDSDTPTDTFVYAYDKYGRPTSESYNDTEKVTYTYTQGNESVGTQSINEIVDGYNDQTVNYTYDDDNSVKKVSIKQTSTEATLLETEKLSADAVNYTFNSSNTDVYTVQIVYDSEKTIGQQVKETKVLSANNIKYAYISKEYTYDDFGRLASSKYYNASSNDPATNSITDARTSYKYRNNAPNQFEEVNYAYSFTSHYPAGWFVHTSSKDTTFRYHDILYDERGNVTQLKESCEIKEKDILETEESVVSTYTVTSTYGYDNFNRLTSETNEKLGLTASYEYDVNNRLHKATRNGVEKTYYYDGRGRLALVCTDGVELGESYRYDNYGNRTSYSKTIYQDTAYVWTRGNLLAEIDKTDKIIRYKYDHTGVRTEKAIGAITTTYYWDSGKLIGEDRVSTDGTTNKLRYFYDLKGICGFSYDGTTYSYIKDIFGNVTALMVGVGLIARYSYDAWGNHKVYNPDGTENTEATFIGNINPIRYRGYYYDTESGLYYLQSRYYDPEIGQFISMDTPNYLKPDTIGGVDLYAYCNNNPVNYKQNPASFDGSVTSSVFPFCDNTLPEVPWLINNSTTIYGAISSLSAGIPILIHYYKYASIINDEFKLYGISKWKTSLQLSNVSFKLGALDGALIGVNVLIDMYDSYQRGVSPEGILLGGALTAASGVGMLYLNKGIMWATTIIGTAICPGIGTAIGFTVGLIGSILVDIFLGGWIANWIDDNIK